MCSVDGVHSIFNLIDFHSNSISVDLRFKACFENVVNFEIEAGIYKKFAKM